MLSFFLPRSCLNCSEHIGSKYGDELLQHYLCENCARIVHSLSIPTPDDHFDKLHRFESLGAEVNISGAYNFSEAGGIAQTLVHHAKYNSMMKLAISLGELAAERLPSDLVNYDYIIPIPLHRTRFAERGYNQAEKIGEGLSTYFSVPLAKRSLLRRIKPTPSQTGLNIDEREDNVRDAFALSKEANLIKDKRVILLDDVMTTGATLASAAYELDQAEPSEIAVVSICVVEEGF
jgi:ComF family protein